jgi:CheY-like chemotaxis protein
MNAQDMDISQPDPRSTMPPATSNGHNGAKPGILVVDDDHLARVLLQLGLERDGFDVWLAENGKQAIDRYRESWEKIDVVLLDVCMPGLDGPHTLDALRDLNPEVPACFMSGDTGAYEPETLIQRGAAYVIAKPFRLERLTNILRSLLNGVPADRFLVGEECKA